MCFHSTETACSPVKTETGSKEPEGIAIFKAGAAVGYDKEAYGNVILTSLPSATAESFVSAPAVPLPTENGTPGDKTKNWELQHRIKHKRFLDVLGEPRDVRIISCYSCPI